MITRIEIDGFKSFRNFSMNFSPFTVIAGINASGKSNLFDALELLSRLAEHDLKEAFPDKRGTVQEQFTILGNHLYHEKMTFAIEMLVKRNVKDKWGGEAELNSPRLRYELAISIRKDQHGFPSLSIDYEYLSKINPDEDSWAKRFLGDKYKKLWKTTRSGGTKEPFIKTKEENGLPTIYIRQDARKGKNAAASKTSVAERISQTVLSGIINTDFPHAFAAKEEMKGWRFMQLNPEALRQPSIQDHKIIYEISRDGSNLAAALFRIKSTEPNSLIGISRLLNKFLPEYNSVDVIDDKENKQFVIVLKNIDGKEFTSRVLSEGTLRVLTLCIMRYDESYEGLLCFEEPENGIHPQRIEDMIALLEGLTVDYDDNEVLLRQVIINTHSPKLIACLCNAEKRHNPSVSVWLSKMVPMIVNTKGNIKSILRVTKISPVENNPFQELFSTEENKMTAAALKSYLEKEISLL
jgi:predicted ATPase